MASEIVTAIIALVCSLITGWGTHLVTKRKYNAEVDNQQIQNLNEAFDLYRKTAKEALDSQRQMMEETITSQNQKIKTLQEENDDLRQRVNQLQAQILNLVKDLYSAGKDFNSLLPEQ